MLRLAVLVGAVISLLCPSCAGAAKPSAPKAPPALRIDETKYLTADKLRPGMKGYGLTVFRGVEPERFDVEIIGVMHNIWDVQSDIILIRCSGKNLEHTGIAAGMSGSPIFVNGKLIGALAYGFPFAKVAVAGVTPIAEMLPLAVRRPPPKAKSGPASARLEKPLELFGREFREVRFLAARPSSRPRAAGTLQMCPIATPVRLSGLGPPRVARELLRRFGPDLESVGLAPVLGGSVHRAVGRDARIARGTTVGARLLWGDLNWDAIGTVTEVLGKRVLAFGHPMYGEADVDIPMTTGYIFTFLPRINRTFKMGTGVRIVGRIDTDRSRGIAGTLGATGRSVRLAVSVSGLEGGKTRKYRFEALRHPRLTPTIIGMAVSSCLFQQGEPPEELTVRYKVTVRPEGFDPIVLDNVESGYVGWGAAAGVYHAVRRVVAALTDNPFRRVYPASVRVEAVFEPVRRFAILESAALNRTILRRGETARLTVELKALNGVRTRKTVDLPIPRDAPLGVATVQVCDASHARAADRRDRPTEFDPQNIDALVVLLRKEYRRDHLYIRLSRPGVGLAIQGKELPDLPPSVYGVMASRRQTGLRSVRRSTVLPVPCGVVVSGTKTLRLKIEEEK